MSAYNADIVSGAVLLGMFRRRWLLILVCLAIGSTAGLVAALTYPSFYRAEITLAPAADLSSGNSSGLGSLASQFGGVASLAGINLGATGTDRATVTLETLRGRAFLVDFAKRRNLVVPLFAANGRNKTTGEITIDPGVYDENSKQWRGALLKSGGPSDAEIYRQITRRIKITQDRRSGIITVDVDSRSPVLAARWALQLISDLNEYVRARDSEEAQRTLAYLDKQIAETQLQDLRQVFYRLFEEQTKIVMLAKVRTEYALKIVDAPLIPDRPVWPGKAAMVAIGGLGGLALGLLLSLLGFGGVNQVRGRIAVAREPTSP